MVGKCCGQGRNQQKSFREMNDKRCVTDTHDEEICHGTGERRRDLIDQLKIFLEDFDERPCAGRPIERGPGGLKPLGQYPDYLKKHCQSWMPGPRPPLITSVQTHELRPTEDYENMRHENSEYVTYVDSRSKPPPASCDCVKRNGLQDQCPRPECTPPTPQCLATNPGPCCPPSLGLTRADAARGVGPSGLSRPRHTPQMRDYNQQQGFATSSTTPPAPGSNLRMICFCKASPSGMPSGQKYICCPNPIQ